MNHPTFALSDRAWEVQAEVQKHRANVWFGYDMESVRYRVQFRSGPQSLRSYMFLSPNMDCYDLQRVARFILAEMEAQDERLKGGA